MGILTLPLLVIDQEEKKKIQGVRKRAQKFHIEQVFSASSLSHTKSFLPVECEKSK